MGNFHYNRFGSGETEIIVPPQNNRIINAIIEKKPKLEIIVFKQSEQAESRE